MGGCLTKSSFTVNSNVTETKSIRTYPIMFSVNDAEMVLRDASLGTYILYKDWQSNKIFLSVRIDNCVRHHRILQVDKLFYLEKQPYPYLDSILFYHRKHKLKGVKLKQQAQLSARVVKAFTVKVTANNGNITNFGQLNIPHKLNNGGIWKCGSMDSLVTSSSGASS
ncbi:uncharacterized protein LOC121381214 [Gigantopelta aegis]|uniref:uncharacterized protein LOC121381214 n=1 Tax=Gigantopelta aegis TaxID=1735272 RepID=UPI001B8889F3|nr:uncharacterized protein LOC121381214 [Gigantopelta aegis]